MSGVWGGADPALGIERDPVQVEGQEVPPVRAGHFGGSEPLTYLSLCDKMGSTRTCTRMWSASSTIRNFWTQEVLVYWRVIQDHWLIRTGKEQSHE